MGLSSFGRFRTHPLSLHSALPVEQRDGAHAMSGSGLPPTLQDEGSPGTTAGSFGVDQAERYRALMAAPAPVDDHQVDPRVRSAGERMSSRVRHHYRWVQLSMACTDVASVVAAFAFAVLAIGIFSAFRLYSVQRIAAAEEFRRLVLAVTLIVTMAVTFSFWSKASFSRLWIAGSWLFSLILVLATRYQWRSYVRRQRERGVLALRTLIVGANAEAGRVATEMRRSDLGFVPLGYVCADGWGRPTTDIPMLGHIDDLSELIHQTDADCLFVAASAIHPEHMVQVSK